MSDPSNIPPPAWLENARQRRAWTELAQRLHREGYLRRTPPGGDNPEAWQREVMASYLASRPRGGVHSVPAALSQYRQMSSDELAMSFRTEGFRIFAHAGNAQDRQEGAPQLGPDGRVLINTPIPPPEHYSGRPEQVDRWNSLVRDLRAAGYPVTDQTSVMAAFCNSFHRTEEQRRVSMLGNQINFDTEFSRYEGRIRYRYDGSSAISEPPPMGPTIKLAP